MKNESEMIDHGTSDVKMIHGANLDGMANNSSNLFDYLCGVGIELHTNQNNDLNR